MRNCAGFRTFLLLVLVAFLVCGCSKEAEKQSHLQKGDESFAKGQFKEAAIEYKNVVQIEPNNAHAVQRLALAYYSLGEIPQAFPFLLRTRDLKPDDLDIRLKLATVFFAGGKRDESKKEADAILEKDPKNLDALILLSSLARTEDEVTDVFSRLSELQPDFQNDPKYHLIMGKLYMRKGNMTAAENSFWSALQGQSNSVEAHLAIADLAVIKKDFKQAEQEYKAAVEIGGDGKTALVKLADFYLFTGQPGDAKKVLEPAMGKDPDFQPFTYRLARIALQENDYEKASKLIDSIFEKNKSDLEGKLLRGQLALAQRRPGDAIGDFQELVKASPDSSQIHYFLGLAYAQSGDLAQAKSELKQAAGMAPNFLEAKVRLAEVNVKTGDYGAARQDLLQVLEKSPRQLESLILLAEAARSPSELAQALQFLKNASLEHKGNPRFHLALGSLYLRTKDFANAEAAYTEVLSTHSEMPELHLALGDLYAAQKDMARADLEYKKALELDPKSTPASSRLTDLQILGKNPEEARAVLTDLVARNPGNTLAYLRLARLAFDEHNYDECLKNLEPVLKKNPSDPEGRVLKGQIHLVHSEWTLAREDFQEALKVQSKSPQIMYLLGVSYLKAGDLNQARAQFRDALGSAPEFKEAGYQLAELDLRTGAYQSVIDSLERLYPEADKPIDVLILLGTANMGMNQAEKAVALFRKATIIKPDDPRGYHLLGVSLRAQNKLPEAREQFEAALRVSPGFVEALVMLTGLDLADNRSDIALQRVKLALEKQPDSAQLLEMLGRIYLIGKDDVQAEAAFSKATEKDPGALGAYMGLAELFARSKKYDEALVKLNDAVRINPKNTPALMLSAMLYQQKGDISKSQELYERILDIQPNFSAAANNLAFIYAEHRGDYQKALKLAQTAKESAPDNPQIADTLGWVLYKMKNYDWALSQLQASASKLPDNAEVQYHLGMAYYQLGSSDDAKKALNKALELNPSFQGAEEAKKALSGL